MSASVFCPSMRILQPYDRIYVHISSERREPLVLHIPLFVVQVDYNLVLTYLKSKTPSTFTVGPSDHREDYKSYTWPFYSLVQTFCKSVCHLAL